MPIKIFFYATSLLIVFSWFLIQCAKRFLLAPEEEIQPYSLPTLSHSFFLKKAIRVLS